MIREGDGHEPGAGQPAPNPADQDAVREGHVRRGRRVNDRLVGVRLPQGCQPLPGVECGTRWAGTDVFLPACIHERVQCANRHGCISNWPLSVNGRVPRAAVPDPEPEDVRRPSPFDRRGEHRYRRAAASVHAQPNGDWTVRNTCAFGRAPRMSSVSPQERQNKREPATDAVPLKRRRCVYGQQPGFPKIVSVVDVLRIGIKHPADWIIHSDLSGIAVKSP